MGLFGKKKKTVDLQQVFKDKYKDINQIVNDANNELDLSLIHISEPTRPY